MRVKRWVTHSKLHNITHTKIVTNAGFIDRSGNGGDLAYIFFTKNGNQPGYIFRDRATFIIPFALIEI